MLVFVFVFESEREREREIDVCMCVCVCEREREREYRYIDRWISFQEEGRAREEKSEGEGEDEKNLSIRWDSSAQNIDQSPADRSGFVASCQAIALHFPPRRRRPLHQQQLQCRASSCHDLESPRRCSQ